MKGDKIRVSRETGISPIFLLELATSYQLHVKIVVIVQVVSTYIQNTIYIYVIVSVTYGHCFVFGLLLM